MMTDKVKDFIVNSLETLVSKFDNIQCRYGYDGLDDIHYIEIVPSYFFKLSKELKRARGNILDNFYRNYSNQSLAFITDDSHIELIDKVVINGSKYSFTPTVATTLNFDHEPLARHYNELVHLVVVGADAEFTNRVNQYHIIEGNPTILDVNVTCYTHSDEHFYVPNTYLPTKLVVKYPFVNKNSKLILA